MKEDCHRLSRLAFSTQRVPRQQDLSQKKREVLFSLVFKKEIKLLRYK